MAVMFSKVPEYYASVFGELTYTMTGIESGTVADAEVYAAGEDTPLGVKRVAGGAAPTVNIACYMRRRIAPVPFSGAHTGYFADAGRFLIEKEKGSIGMIQRAFKVGFNRAARIMDQLCEAGVVGPEEGTKPRKVLMSMEEFEQYLEES